MLHEYNKLFIGSCTLTYFRLYFYLYCNHEITVLYPLNLISVPFSKEIIHGMTKIVSRGWFRLKEIYQAKLRHETSLFKSRFEAKRYFSDKWGNSMKDWVRAERLLILSSVMRTLRLCLKRQCWDLSGGAVAGNPPANTGDTGSIPGLGRCHMPWSN